MIDMFKALKKRRDELIAGKRPSVNEGMTNKSQADQLRELEEEEAEKNKKKP